MIMSVKRHICDFSLEQVRTLKLSEDFWAIGEFHLALISRSSFSECEKIFNLNSHIRILHLKADDFYAGKTLVRLKLEQTPPLQEARRSLASEKDQSITMGARRA